MSSALSLMQLALRAEGPIAAYSEKMMLYGQFVGAWRGIVRFPSAGAIQEISCEVLFDWILEGRAIQDVWIAPARTERDTDLPSDNLYGTTIRIFDPERDTWSISWFNPTTQAFNCMEGRKLGNDIIQEYISELGITHQWCFTEITKDSFHWIARESVDNGRNWTIGSEFFLKRQD